MRQTRGRDDFIRGIGLKIQRTEIQAHLARNGPDMHLVQTDAGSSNADCHDPLWMR